MTFVSSALAEPGLTQDPISKIEIDLGHFTKHELPNFYGSFSQF